MLREFLRNPKRFLKNHRVGHPRNRGHECWYSSRGGVQAAFSFASSSWAHFSLSFVASVFLTTQYMQLSRGWGYSSSPSPCTHTLCPFETRAPPVLEFGLVSPKGLTPLISAFMPLSLEGDESEAGRLGPACRM